MGEGGLFSKIWLSSLKRTWGTWAWDNSHLPSKCLQLGVRNDRQKGGSTKMEETKCSANCPVSFETIAFGGSQKGKWLGNTDGFAKMRFAMENGSGPFELLPRKLAEQGKPLICRKPPKASEYLHKTRFFTRRLQARPVESTPSQPLGPKVG